jgi:hypothetical protein
MRNTLRHRVARAALALSTLAFVAGSHASSYTASFTNVTFYYAGLTTFNDTPSDGSFHSYFSGDVSGAGGIVGPEGGSMRMTGELSYELVLDGQDGDRCDSAMLWFGWVVGPAVGEPHGPPLSLFCEASTRTYSMENWLIDTGDIGLDSGPVSAYFSDLTRLGFIPTAVPEPATYALLLAGLAGVGSRARYRASRNADC